MALPKKEVKVRLDDDVHEALTKLAEIAGTGLAEWAEGIVEEAIRAELHRHMVRKPKLESLSLYGKMREELGK